MGRRPNDGARNGGETGVCSTWKKKITSQTQSIQDKAKSASLQCHPHGGGDPGADEKEGEEAGADTVAGGDRGGDGRVVDGSGVGLAGAGIGHGVAAGGGAQRDVLSAEADEVGGQHAEHGHVLLEAGGPVVLLEVPGGAAAVAVGAGGAGEHGGLGGELQLGHDLGAGVGDQLGGGGEPPGEEALVADHVAVAVVEGLAADLAHDVVAVLFGEEDGEGGLEEGVDAGFPGGVGVGLGVNRQTVRQIGIYMCVRACIGTDISTHRIIHIGSTV
jgi:hypothetical protein